MAVENYFDPAEERPVARDTQSSDNSKSGVRAAWDAFTSRPENNAALLQFGISMLQPRATNQTSLGQFGQAIGEAGEASSRNIAAQNQELDREAQRAERLSTAEYRGKQGDAALINARAYEQAVRANPANAAGGAGGARTLLSAQLRTQQAFRQWLIKPEDPIAAAMGGGEPLIQAISKQFPQVKSKSDLLLPQNRAAMDAAARLYTQQFGEAAQPGDTDYQAPAAGAAPPPAAAQPPRPGAAGMSVPPGPPPEPGARFWQGRWYRRGPAGEPVPID